VSAPGSTCGLILAAGDGSRFGPRSKLLAELGGRPLLEHAIRAQTEVGELERVVVVLGAHAEEVLAGVEFGRAEPIVCERWCDGMAWSLRAGADALRRAGRVIVTLGDAPTVTTAVVRRFLTAPAGARAVYAGRPGHPVVLGGEQLERLRSLSGDVGARAMLGCGPLIECSDLCSGRDVDTVRDLQEVRDEARAVV
jgi:CTP:molybdopterin cytidylyltransferase MocA